MSFTAVDLVLAVARALDFAREVPRNSNWGQAVQRFLVAVGWKKPQPWCAAYVSYVGSRALGAAWPLPLTAGCATLGDAAEAKQLLQHTPARGDVFLLKSPSLGRFAHTGFIVAVNADGSCVTLEGNTNDGGSRDGWGVFQRTRHFAPADRFIRWNDAH